jgi:polyhydroxybutyrate depolymerase
MHPASRAASYAVAPAAKRSRMLSIATAVLICIALGLTFAPAASAAAHSEATVSAPVAAPLGAAGTDRTITFNAGGFTRSYAVFVPNTLPAHPYLLVDLHQFTGNAADTEQATQFDLGAVSSGTIVVYPQGVGNHWNAGGCCGLTPTTTADDVSFITDVIDDVTARYPIDATKVAIGGFSNGAGMALRYACERSDKISAVFMGSGDLMSSGCTFTHPVHVLDMHGLADVRLPWAGLPITAGLTSVALPPVINVLGGLAALDGCSGWSKTTIAGGVMRSISTPCKNNASVWSFLSPTMPHTWATGAQQLGWYGLDETNLTWYWLMTVWH